MIFHAPPRPQPVPFLAGGRDRNDVPRVQALAAVHHREEGEHPQCWRHDAPLVAQRAQDHAHDALRPLHKPDFALADQRFRACAGVAHHHRAHHYDRSQNHVKEPVDRGVIHQQAHQYRKI